MTANPTTEDPVERNLLLHGAALADGTGPELQTSVGLLVAGGEVAGVFHGEVPKEAWDAAEVIDASGATIVPSFVDCHSHLTLPGGAHWIDRGADPTAELEKAAGRNAALLVASGVRWVRDVGSPRRADTPDGRERALALSLRDQWQGRPEFPYIRAAGTWLTKAGSLPAGLAVEAADADALLAAALGQLDDGADLIKLYLDGPDAGVAPWTAAEVRRVVDAVHGRGATVAAHGTGLANCKLAAESAVDTLEHGFTIDADVARLLAENGVTVVSTLSVLRSWQGFATTTTVDRFTTGDGVKRTAELRETAEASVRAAHAAGVPIAAGSDFGGGSVRAGHLAWEVECLVDAGLEPWEALGAATWRGGDVLGDARAGRIAVGDPAHFTVVHGDPLTEPAALWRVWHVQ